MKPWFYLVNNFAHDLFTGIWCGCFVNILALRFWSGGVLTGLALDLGRLMASLGGLALLAVLATGLLRFRYRREWEREEKQLTAAKKSVLLVKHAVLGLLFLVGSLGAFFWVSP